MTGSAEVDDYVSACPEEVRPVLQGIRRGVRRALPASGETLSGRMPTVTLDGVPRMYFAAWKRHIGVYPVPPAQGALERELAPYRAAKDTVRFPLSRPVPYALIERLATFVAERRGAAAPDRPPDRLPPDRLTA